MSVTVERREARMLAAAPLLAAWDRERAKGTRSNEELAADCGISSSRVRAWRRREATAVEAWTADKVLVGLDVLWWEVFDEDVYPEEHRAAARVFG